MGNHFFRCGAHRLTPGGHLFVFIKCSVFCLVIAFPDTGKLRNGLGEQQGRRRARTTARSETGGCFSLGWWPLNSRREAQNQCCFVERESVRHCLYPTKCQHCESNEKHVPVSDSSPYMRIPLQVPLLFLFILLGLCMQARCHADQQC